MGEAAQEIIISNTGFIPDIFSEDKQKPEHPLLQKLQQMDEVRRGGGHRAVGGKGALLRAPKLQLQTVHVQRPQKEETFKTINGGF